MDTNCSWEAYRPPVPQNDEVMLLMSLAASCSRSHCVERLSSHANPFQDCTPEELHSVFSTYGIASWLGPGQLGFRVFNFKPLP